MRIPPALGFVAGSWLIGAAIHGALWWGMGRTMDVSMFVYFVPLVFAIATSGNVHQPSEIGFVAGILVQWTVIGFVALAIYYGVRRTRSPGTREGS
jgi:hypothetical protein